MIRVATLDDVPKVVEMGLEFGRSSHYAKLFTVDPGRVETLAKTLIEGETSIIYLADDVQHGVMGMIALLIFDHPMVAAKMATEVVWWVQPAHRGTVGLRLLKRAGQWAADHGAEMIQMIAPDEKVGTLYASLGFMRAETAYVRRV